MDEKFTDEEKRVFFKACNKIAKQIGYGQFVIKCHDYDCKDIYIKYDMQVNSNSLDKRIAEAGLGFLSEFFEE